MIQKPKPLANENVSEDGLIRNMAANCQAYVANRPLLCIQDSSEINLANHRIRLKKDDSIGLADGSSLGFLIHPSLVIDAQTFMPYGFAEVKVWIHAHQWVAKARPATSVVNYPSNRKSRIDGSEPRST